MDLETLVCGFINGTTATGLAPACVAFQGCAASSIGRNEDGAEISAGE